MPTQTGWFADRDIFEMDHRRLLRPRRRRGGSQSGTPPIPAIYAGIAGIQLMQEIGIAATREHVNALNERLIAGVDELGGTVMTPREPERRGALVCIRSTDAPALVAALGADGIVTSDRRARTSPESRAASPTRTLDGGPSTPGASAAPRGPHPRRGTVTSRRASTRHADLHAAQVGHLIKSHA